MKLDFDCYQALRARDARFDGRFFVGVKTTGIYCRPVCPARTPRQDSCVFLATAAAAERAGYRPCLRCRPELAPPDPAGDSWHAPLAQALYSTIRARVAHGDGVDQLAVRTGYSPRQLRRLTVAAFGVTPVQIIQTERLLFAKKLLQETSLPMMDVALSAGFGSLRRFNAACLSQYRMPPTALRRQSPGRVPSGDPDVLTLRLLYRPPLAWKELLAYLARRVVPGVEFVSGGQGIYGRTVRSTGKVGWVTVRQIPAAHALEVRAPSVLADVLWSVLTRLRLLLDLDANPLCIDEQLGADALLAGGVRRHPGLRVPGAWDEFELAVRAVLGQQISVVAATTLAARLAARFGARVSTPHAALNRLAPTAETLAGAEPAELIAIGLTTARARTLHELSVAATRGILAFRPAVKIEDVVGALRGIRGIGEWTAQYIAMRALRFPDAFPAADLGLRKAVAPPGGMPVSEKELLVRSQPWRPWRAYAALHLWQALHDASFQPDPS